MTVSRRFQLTQPHPARSLRQFGLAMFEPKGGRKRLQVGSFGEGGGPPAKQKKRRGKRLRVGMSDHDVCVRVCVCACVDHLRVTGNPTWVQALCVGVTDVR